MFNAPEAPSSHRRFSCALGRVDSRCALGIQSQARGAAEGPEEAGDEGWHCGCHEEDESRC